MLGGGGGEEAVYHFRHWYVCETCCEQCGTDPWHLGRGGALISGGSP